MCRGLSRRDGSSRLARVLLIVWTTQLFGCAAKPKPPLQAPDAHVALSHYTGSPLSGPTTRIADTSQPAASVAARVRLIALEQSLAGNVLKPVDPDVRLIIVDRGGAPVASFMRLTRGTLWAD